MADVSRSFSRALVKPLPYRHLIWRQRASLISAPSPRGEFWPLLPPSVWQKRVLLLLELSRLYAGHALHHTRNLEKPKLVGVPHQWTYDLFSKHLAYSRNGFPKTNARD